MNNGFDAAWLGKTINISTLAPGVLPTQLRAVKFLSLMDPATARAFDDIVSRHASITPYLTGWKPARYTDQNYVKVQHPNGAIEYFGTAWLDFETVEEVSDELVLIRLGSLSTEDRNRLRRVLIKAGFEDIRSIATDSGAALS